MLHETGPYFTKGAGPPRDGAIARLAERQHWVVPSPSLAGAGFTSACQDADIWFARRFALVAALALGSAPGAHAASVSDEGGVLRVTAAPAEFNDVDVTVDKSLGYPSAFIVRDLGSQLVPGGGCTPMPFDTAAVTCPVGPSQLEVDLGDGDDQLDVVASTPAVIRGGDGNDRLRGGEGPDLIEGGLGDDAAVGGAGDDQIVMGDRKSDSAVCGPGRDRVRAEVLDQLDISCEVVDYGPPGRVGRLRTITGGGRFVRIPGHRYARIDRRVLPNIQYLVRKYKIRIGDGYALRGHARNGEHPLGLAIDIYPGGGGSWNKVSKLARFAEPRQNRPRPPWRWVGYNGDFNHGRGNHLHLSWAHSRSRPGRPARTVWVFDVKGGDPVALPATVLPPSRGLPQE